jgi:hypothetical protein
MYYVLLSRITETPRRMMTRPQEVRGSQESRVGGQITEFQILAAAFTKTELYFNHFSAIHERVGCDPKHVPRSRNNEWNDIFWATVVFIKIARPFFARGRTVENTRGDQVDARYCGVKRVKYCTLKRPGGSTRGLWRNADEILAIYGRIEFAMERSRLSLSEKDCWGRRWLWSYRPERNLTVSNPNFTWLDCSWLSL